MKSIRRQLTTALLAVFVALQGAGLLVLFIVARKGTISEFDDALRAKALAVSTLIVEGPEGLRTDVAAFFIGVGDITDIEPVLNGPSPESYLRFLQEFHHHGRKNYFEVWDADGRRIARSESLGKGDLPRRTYRADKPLVWDLEVGHEPSRAVGFIFRPQLTGGADPNTRSTHEVQVVVAAEREALDEKLLRLELLTAGCGLALLGATLWAMPRILRRGLQPLNRLGEDVARIDAGSLAMRFPTEDAPAELHVIIDRLNGLMARLEESFERERRFSADVAHELRTPLAELRGMAECALKWPESRDPTTDQETLAIARQMETMVEHMLALARGDQGQLEARFEKVSLDAVVASAWRGLAPRAAERKVNARLAVDAVSASADPSLLRAILNVVLENAVDYTPSGSEISIQVLDEGGQPAIRIANPAPELTPDDVGKIFDRFWRKESARSGGLHLGLGLSLASAYAAAMGWTMSAELDAQHRLVLSLQGIPPGTA
ncbi:MAG: Histidine kinase [Verrucomicrobia bacterium]|nr:Histidine kinase [Verrucomicrobiota bacterium]